MTQHTETQITRLPASLQINDIPIAEALVALGNRLAEIAEMMPLISDIDVTVTVTPEGRCALHFRACR